MTKYAIFDIVSKHEKLLNITITDRRGDMFDLIVPYINPASIFERGFVRVGKGEGLMRRFTLKDSHIHTTRKERTFVINTSVVNSEIFHNISNIDNISVVDQENKELYDSLVDAVKQISEKEDEGTKAS